MLSSLVLALCFTGSGVDLPDLPKNGWLLGNGGHVTYEYSWERKPLAMRYAGLCQNRCRRKLHLVHQECDRSCDELCTGDFRGGRHQFQGGYFVRGNAGSYQPLLDKTGHPTIRAWWLSHAAAQEHRELINKAIGKNNTKRWECWNEKPCSSSTRSVEVEEHVLRARVRVYLFNETTGAETTVGTVDEEVGSVLIPTGKWEDEHDEYCLCTVVRPMTGGGEPSEEVIEPRAEPTKPERPQTGGSTPPATEPVEPAAEVLEGIEGNVLEVPQPQPRTGVLYGPDSSCTPLDDSLIDRFGVRPECQDMNRGSIGASNPFSRDVSLFVPAGTLFDTDANGIQDMITVGDVLLQLPPAPPPPPALAHAFTLLQAACGPADISVDWLIQRRSKEVRVPVRVMCLEMAKKEPNPRTKFRVRQNGDHVAAELARLTSLSSVRGPFDQMRLWIYTDGASHKDIEERLVPAPGAGRYLSALNDVRKAGANLGDTRYAEVFEPSLLLGVAEPATTAWFVRTIAEMNPKALASWAAKDGAALEQLLRPGMPEVAGQHVVNVLNSLALVRSPEARGAALTILEKLPAGARPALAQNGPQFAWSLAWEQDKSLSERALKVLDAYNPPERAFLLANRPKR